MANLNNKQLKQIQNVSHTLLEAIGHFTILAKEKNINECIFTLSTIVDGFRSINKTLQFSDLGVEERRQIEKSLHLIVKKLEQGQLLKVIEIVQFSLQPQVRNWNQLLDKLLVEDANKSEMIIGVYLCQENPRRVYPEGRIKALVEEGQKQGVKMIFFSSKDVNFKKEEIEADVFKNGEWVKEICPFPNVINNLPKVRVQQSFTERKLRRQIPFTGFAIDGKLTLPKKLIESKKYFDLLAPFKITDHENNIYSFIREHEIAVLKPIMGRRGLNIYFVEKTENGYSVLDHKKKVCIK